MADLFTRLARRTLGLMPLVQPRIASQFAPEEAMASENANTEVPSVFDGNRDLAPREQPAPALLSKESEFREREQESITRTILVEIEGETPQKQELTSEELSISQPRKETREQEGRNREKEAIKLTNQPANTEVKSGLRAVNEELVGREKIGDRSGGIELEGIQRLESNSTEAKEKEESFGERVTKGKREIEERREVEEVRREIPGAIASEEGEKKSSARSLKVKGLGENEQRNSPTEEVLSSAPTVRAMGQEANSREWESRGNESGLGESEASINQNKLLGKTSPRTLTANIFSRNQGKSRELVKASTDLDPVTEDKVDSKKVNSLEVDRGIESETPLKSRGAEKLDSKASAEGLSAENTTIALSRKAIAFEMRGKLVSENQLTAPEFSSGESETSLPLWEQEKPRALKGIEEEEKLLSRRDEQLSKLASEIVNELTEEEGGKGKAVKRIEEEKLSSRRDEQLSKLAPEIVNELTEEEGGKGKAVKRIEEEKLSSRRDEQLSKLAPEIVNELTEKRVKKVKAATKRPVKLEEKELTERQVSERLKSSLRAGEESGTENGSAKQFQPGDESRGRIAEVKKQWEENNRNTATEGINEIGIQQEGRSRGDDRTINNPLKLLGSKLVEEQQASVASTPTIQVNIGKIEVRATKPAVKPVAQSRQMHSTISTPKLSLDEYLKQRNG